MFKKNVSIFKFTTVIFALFIIIFSYTSVYGAYGQIDMPSPVSSPVNAGYLYGEKLSSSSTSGHMGLDFAASTGTPVYATYGGKVYRKRDLGNSSYGKYYVIESTHPLYPGTKFYHIYAHLSYQNPNISEGSNITQGTYLGDTGSSGNATGPHLHYEIRMGSYDYYAQRNPEGLLSRSTSNGYGALRGRVNLSNNNWARAIRISGASKPDVNYGASYSYFVMDNSNPFPDESAYGINYYIARAYTGNIMLNYNNGARTLNATVSSNTDTLLSTVTLP